MKEFIKKCFSLSILWQVTPMPAQCSASALPAAACLATACRPWQMGFSHVCHLLRAPLPFSGHKLKPHQLSRQLWKVGRASKKGEGMELPQEPQEHYIQNTLNSAWRLNAAELVLPLTGREPATPALLTTFNCSCFHAHTTAQASGPTPLSAAAEIPAAQVCSTDTNSTGAGVATGSLGEMGHMLQSFLLQNWNKSASLPFGVQIRKHSNSKSTLILKWSLLKKTSRCSIIRWEMQHSILLRAHLEKLVHCFFCFFPWNITLVCGCPTNLDLNHRKQI